jgi:hypothetical protein
MGAVHPDRIKLLRRLLLYASSLAAGIVMFVTLGALLAATLALAAAVLGGLLVLGGQHLLRKAKPIGVWMSAASVTLPLGLGAAAVVLASWSVAQCDIGGWGARLFAAAAAALVVGGGAAALPLLLPAMTPGRLVRRTVTDAFGEKFVPRSDGYDAVHDATVAPTGGPTIAGRSLRGWSHRIRLIARAQPPPPQPKAPPLVYDHPTASCDVVMKGGITSGVIYPLTVCELATVYRLKNIGGTSAGAIAATAAAAAEYGRDTGGYNKLEALPTWLATGSNLLHLFQPQRPTRHLFRLMTAGIGHDPLPVRVGRILRVLVWSPAGVLMVLGAAPGAYLVWRGLHQTTCAPAVWAAGVLPALLGIVLAVLAWLLFQARNIPKNGFGLCSGHTDPGFSVPALTDWLTAELETIAGRVGAENRPLTFGHLWLKREPDPKSDPDKAALERAENDLEARFINLEMMTTNLSQQRPYRFPSIAVKDEWFFDPAEFRKLFPAPVVTWMEKHPRPPHDRDAPWIRELVKPLLPLPAPADIPIVVAARFSLSFPMLLSAIPLYALDWGRDETQRAVADWRRWGAEDTARLNPLVHEAKWTAATKQAWNDRKAECERRGLRLVAERSLFSDGGISSNFPVHFFDSLIPSRPSFAVNLRDFHPDHPRDPTNERRNVLMPTVPQGGIIETLSQIPAGGGLGSIVTFFMALINTARNWHDSVLTRAPGHRDRIVHVSHTKREGGMNLNMPADVITALTSRGRMAGERLRVRFSQDPARWDLAQAGYDAPAPPPSTTTSDAAALPAFDPSKALGWDYQRWTRLRSAAARVQESLEQLEGAINEPQPPYREGDGIKAPLTYAELIARDAGALPDWYKIGPTQRERIQTMLQRVGELAATWAEDGPSARLDYGEPRPESELRITPRI